MIADTFVGLVVGAVFGIFVYYILWACYRYGRERQFREDYIATHGEDPDKMNNIR